MSFRSLFVNTFINKTKGNTLHLDNRRNIFKNVSFAFEQKLSLV